MPSDWSDSPATTGVDCGVLGPDCAIARSGPVHRGGTYDVHESFDTLGLVGAIDSWPDGYCYQFNANSYTRSSRKRFSTTGAFSSKGRSTGSGRLRWSRTAVT